MTLVVHDPESMLLIPVPSQSDQILVQFALDNRLSPKAFEELRNLIQGRNSDLNPLQLTVRGDKYENEILGYGSRLPFPTAPHRFSSEAAQIVIDLVVQHLKAEIADVDFISECSTFYRHDARKRALQQTRQLLANMARVHSTWSYPALCILRNRVVLSSQRRLTELLDYDRVLQSITQLALEGFHERGSTFSQDSDVVALLLKKVPNLTMFSVNLTRLDILSPEKASSLAEAISQLSHLRALMFYGFSVRSVDRFFSVFFLGVQKLKQLRTLSFCGWYEILTDESPAMDEESLASTITSYCFPPKLNCILLSRERRFAIPSMDLELLEADPTQRGPLLFLVTGNYTPFDAASRQLLRSFKPLVQVKRLCIGNVRIQQDRLLPYFLEELIIDSDRSDACDSDLSRMLAFNRLSRLAHVLIIRSGAYCLPSPDPLDLFPMTRSYCTENGIQFDAEISKISFMDDLIRKSASL